MLFLYNFGLTKVLIVGDTPTSKELVDSLINSRLSGYKVTGVVSSKQYAPTHYSDLKVFDTFEAAIQKLGVGDVHSIVQTELYADSNRNNAILDFAQQNHIAFRFIPGNTELFVGNIQVELFRQSLPVIAVHQTPLIGWGRVIKRLFDLIIAGLFLVTASPLMLLIALINKPLSGSVFFRQTRLTRFNQEFKVFKFQTVKTAYNHMTPEEAFVKMGKPELIKVYRENGDQINNVPPLRLVRALPTRH